MKKITKFTIGSGVLLFGIVMLSGCTASFCDVNDKSHILFNYDFGVSQYVDASSAPEGAEDVTLTINGVDTTLPNVKKVLPKTNFETGLYYYGEDNTVSTDFTYLNSITTSAVSKGISVPSYKYWAAFDRLLLEDAIEEIIKEDSAFNVTFLTASDIALPTTNETIEQNIADNKEQSILYRYGYLKYYDSVNETKVLWTNFDSYNAEIRNNLTTFDLTIDECATTDYISAYKTQMNTYVTNARSCLAINEGNYGNYGQNELHAYISSKSWKSSFEGFHLLEGILVWPIGAFVDVLSNGFAKMGLSSSNGVPQILAILIVTIIVRSIMLLLTFKSTQSNAKMTELQPEITRIQNKYPNANTNNYEKQQMAMEMQSLYKKNGINPLSSIVVMIVQFPVFICVWGALQGSAVLSTGTFLGLNLSASISSVLFNAAEWKLASGGGALTALILFILMSGSQAVAMLLPQWLQKAREKQAIKLGRNPAKKEQDNKMKWFTYIMLAMIIFMGFSLVSALGVYWFVGAIFSIVQTLITQYAANNSKKKEKR